METATKTNKSLPIEAIRELLVSMERVEQVILMVKAQTEPCEMTALEEEFHERLKHWMRWLAPIEVFPSLRASWEQVGVLRGWMKRMLEVFHAKRGRGGLGELERELTVMTALWEEFLRLHTGSRTAETSQRLRELLRMMIHTEIRLEEF